MRPEILRVSPLVMLRMSGLAFARFLEAHVIATLALSAQSACVQSHFGELGGFTPEKHLLIKIDHRSWRKMTQVWGSLQGRTCLRVPQRMTGALYQTKLNDTRALLRSQRSPRFSPPDFESDQSGCSTFPSSLAPSPLHTHLPMWPPT